MYTFKYRDSRGIFVSYGRTAHMMASVPSFDDAVEIAQKQMGENPGHRYPIAIYKNGSPVLVVEGDRHKLSQSDWPDVPRIGYKEFPRLVVVV